MGWTGGSRGGADLGSPAIARMGGSPAEPEGRPAGGRFGPQRFGSRLDYGVPPAKNAVQDAGVTAPPKMVQRTSSNLTALVNGTCTTTPGSESFGPASFGTRSTSLPW